MMEVLLFVCEMVAGGLCAAAPLCFVLFLVLRQREIQWQRDHCCELAQERREFRQPEWEMVEDVPFFWGRPRYELVRRYFFKWMGRVLDIPERYWTDGASVPRPFWSLTGYLPDGKHRAAAVTHDFLCDERPWWCNWIDAAGCFRHYQRLANVRPAKIVVMHAMVVIFGPKWLRRPEPEVEGEADVEGEEGSGRA